MKKILIKILLIIFLPNSAFAAVKNYLVTCEGTVTTTSSTKDKERDIFYDDLDFFIVTNNKSKETHIQEIVIESTSKKLYRYKTWIRDITFFRKDNVIYFDQPKYLTQDKYKDTVSGFRGSLNLRTGRYNANQSVRGSLVAVYWKVLAKCQGLDKISNALK